MSRKKTAARSEREEARHSPSPSGYQVPLVLERSLLPDEELITTTIRYPRYVARLMERWLLDHPGHTKTSLLLNGLRALGQPILNEDLLPRRHQGRG